MQCSLVPCFLDAVWIGKIAEVGKIVFGLDCWEVKNCWGIEQMLVGIVRIILLSSKGGIGRWKLTEVKEWVFLGDCWGGCMHIEDCENNGAPTIF